MAAFTGNSPGALSRSRRFRRGVAFGQTFPVHFRPGHAICARQVFGLFCGSDAGFAGRKFHAVHAHMRRAGCGAGAEYQKQNVRHVVSPVIDQIIVCRSTS